MILVLKIGNMFDWSTVFLYDLNGNLLNSKRRVVLPRRTYLITGRVIMVAHMLLSILQSKYFMAVQAEWHVCRWGKARQFWILHSWRRRIVTTRPKWPRVVYHTFAPTSFHRKEQGQHRSAKIEMEQNTWWLWGYNGKLVIHSQAFTKPNSRLSTLSMGSTPQCAFSVQ